MERPKGFTRAENLRRKESSIKEREDCLREEGVRRSDRLNKHYAQLIESASLPNNFIEARDSREGEKWKEAMEDESKSLENHDVWCICERPKSIKVIKSY